MITLPLAIDVIGDVHGCYDALQRLLYKLGYEQQQGVFVHPQGRQAIFAGDLIDRGDQIVETVNLVKAMCEAGSARMVLGNHEYTALRHGAACREYIQTGSSDALPARLQKLMRETLEQYQQQPDQWDSALEWMLQLPLYIDEPDYRIVHACWDTQLIDQLKKEYPSNCLSPEFMQLAQVKGSLHAQAVDRLTRGINIPLPEGMTVESRDGYKRRFFRSKFWSRSPKTYGDLVFQPDPLPSEVDESPLREQHQDELVYYSPKDVPLFFGHYWLSGKPEPLRQNIACVDYSAVSPSGRLTAYCFDGEEALSPDKFIWVYHDPYSDDALNESEQAHRNENAGQQA